MDLDQADCPFGAFLYFAFIFGVSGSLSYREVSFAAQFDISYFKVCSPGLAPHHDDLLVQLVAAT